MIGNSSLGELAEVLEIIAAENEFGGYTMTYNDGAHDRASGFDESAASVYVEVARPSAHESLAARLQLRQYLAERVSADDVRRLLAP